jgi:hypothetical protein
MDGVNANFVYNTLNEMGAKIVEKIILDKNLK